jgi:hypothetical protein
LVWESDHPIASRGQNRLTFGIPIPLLGMNPTVELDYQAALRAAEVDNERTDRVLPAELHPVQATAT